jgi:hypothetical protein
MKYIYRILSHNAEKATLQVKLSCLDMANVGVIDLPYPHVNGTPTFSEAKVHEQVMLHFHADLTNWEMNENNKARHEEIKVEADVLVGKAVSFDHSIEDFAWIDQTEKLRPISEWYKDNGEDK